MILEVRGGFKALNPAAAADYPISGLTNRDGDNRSWRIADIPCPPSASGREQKVRFVVENSRKRPWRERGFSLSPELAGCF